MAVQQDAAPAVDMIALRDVRLGRLVAIVAFVGIVVSGLVIATGATAPWDADDPPAGDVDAVDPGSALGSVHDAGVTGEDRRVGIVDVSRVDADHPALADGLVEARTFADGGGRFDVAGDHGTAATATVARTAPDADLYVAAVDDEASFVEAVEWLRTVGVDVIVAPVTFYGKPGDGQTLADRAVDRTVADGTVFVAPAGNLGASHWRGRYNPTGGTHAFAGEARNGLEGESSTVSLWLSWGDPDGEFTLELYREGEGEPVARSEPHRGDGLPNARLVADVDPDASYAFEVRGPPDATGIELRVESPTHRFERSWRDGSVAPPGTARRAVTVGAYDADSGVLARFSGAGPTADGRPAVDVLAPTRLEPAARSGVEGTSASAAYVAGVAALLLEANPSLAPAEVEAVLEGTATEPPGHREAALVGGGQLDPVAAVERASGDASDEGGADDEADHATDESDGDADENRGSDS